MKSSLHNFSVLRESNTYIISGIMFEHISEKHQHFLRGRNNVWICFNSDHGKYLDDTVQNLKKTFSNISQRVQWCTMKHNCFYKHWIWFLSTRVDCIFKVPITLHNETWRWNGGDCLGALLSAHRWECKIWKIFCGEICALTWVKTK